MSKQDSPKVNADGKAVYEVLVPVHGMQHHRMMAAARALNGTVEQWIHYAILRVLDLPPTTIDERIESLTNRVKSLESELDSR